MNKDYNLYPRYNADGKRVTHNKDMILMSKAASYFGTSFTVLTEQELKNYLISVVDFNYPRLESNQPIVYKAVTFKPLTEIEQQQLDSLNFDPYEWWLAVPIGDQSSSRDVGDVWAMFHIGKGDEWNESVETVILKFQNKLPSILLPTGYVCNETLRRGRLML